MLGGIDLGGTKIEATLFAPDLTARETRRTATPGQDYDALIRALAEQVAWLKGHAGGPLPVGVGIPGLYNAATGQAFTANLPASGRDIRRDIVAATGQAITFENDCNCFALSEAVGGAGADARSVFGLILGTGVGGGLVLDGHLIRDHNGVSGEVGHVALPADLIAELGLPLVRCGCGRLGCYETYVAGPGMTRIAQALGAGAMSPVEITRARAQATGDGAAQEVWQCWCRIAARLMGMLQATMDPAAIVLGGGLSNIEGIADALNGAIGDVIMDNTLAPVVRVASFGDASGARGAAISALHAQETR